MPNKYSQPLPYQDIDVVSFELDKCFDFIKVRTNAGMFASGNFCITLMLQKELTYFEDAVFFDTGARLGLRFQFTSEQVAQLKIAFANMA